jgi:hypothetical protein
MRGNFHDTGRALRAGVQRIVVAAARELSDVVFARGQESPAETTGRRRRKAEGGMRNEGQYAKTDNLMSKKSWIEPTFRVPPSAFRVHRSRALMR